MSIAEIVNEILSGIQLNMENDGYEFDGDLVDMYGLESAEWDLCQPYNPPEDHEIDNFLQRFHQWEHDVTMTFTSGCCYWFAAMLHERFPESRIMFSEKKIQKYTKKDLEFLKKLHISPEYDCSTLHFVTEINGRLYDITGDVTGKYEVVPWDEVDPRKKRYIESSAVFWDDWY